MASVILFSVADPQGDALGDGGYTLPASLRDASGQNANLDVRAFTAKEVDGKLELRLSFAQLTNPQAAPNGFSTPSLHLFLAETRGGQEVLGNTGFHTPPGQGWQYHISASGWWVRLECAPSVSNCDATGLQAKAEGADVVIRTALPAKPYAYWAFTGLYDPLSMDGLRQPVAQASTLDLSSSLADAPAALEVVSKTSQVGYYGTREVPPLGELIATTNPLLWSGLAGLCLLVGGGMWSLLRRVRG